MGCNCNSNFSGGEQDSANKSLYQSYENVIKRKNKATLLKTRQSIERGLNEGSYEEGVIPMMEYYQKKLLYTLELEVGKYKKSMAQNTLNASAPRMPPEAIEDYKGRIVSADATIKKYEGLLANLKVPSKSKIGKYLTKKNILIFGGSVIALFVGYKLYKKYK